MHLLGVGGCHALYMSLCTKLTDPFAVCRGEALASGVQTGV